MRTDGITVHGALKVGSCWYIWDVTCPDTFASFYSLSAITEAALCTGRRQNTRFLHSFTPIAIETTGVLGLTFVEELGAMGASRVTGSEVLPLYLLQRLSVVVQRGNSTSVMEYNGRNGPTPPPQTFSLELRSIYLVSY